MVKIFSMTERVDETGKRENGKRHIGCETTGMLLAGRENGSLS